MLSIVVDAIRLLPTLRADTTQWPSFAYKEARHPEFGRQDANERERYRILIALQYEHISADEELVRYLFDHEVTARSNDDFQGYGESLRLASYLLSRWKRPGDFWRFAQAKLANSDTVCGYDSQFLFAIGSDTALTEFATSDHPLKEATREYLIDECGNCRFSSDDIRTWEEGLAAEFPRRPEDDTLLAWIARAIAFQSLDEGRALLDRYEATHPDVTFDSLAHSREQLGDYSGAVEKRRRILALSKKDWDRVSNAHSLAEVLLKDARPAEAWTTILECDPFLMRIERWREVGLGRSVVEVAFRIAKEAPFDIATAAFAWASAREKQLKVSSLLVLTLAAEAADVVRDSDSAIYYRAAAKAEQYRIDQMMKK